MAKYSGKKGKAVINGVTFNIRNWEAEDDGGSVDVSDTADDGYSDHECGIRSLRATIDYIFDSVGTPSGAGLVTGDTITNVTLQRADSGNNVSIDEALVDRVTISNPHDGAVGGQAVILNKGEFSFGG